MPEHTPEETRDALRRHGVTLPRHERRQLEVAEDFNQMFYRLDTAKALGRGSNPYSQRTASFSGNGFSGSSAQLAMPRYFDPVSSFGDQRGTSIVDMEQPETRKRMHQYCRLFYATHPIVGALIDIYSRFPIVGMEFSCDDAELERFYTELFIEDLDYENFFIDLGKEYWTVGESFPLGAWDEDLGIWVHEELMNADDLEVHRVPLTGERLFFLKPTEYMKTLCQTRDPRPEYEIFAAEFGDLIPYIERNENIPVSSEVMNQIARYNTSRDVRGTPILTRGIQSLMLESRLDAALQATADRMYAPLTLFKVGMDFGDGKTWIPGPDQLANIRTELDLALASDFRALVTHFAISATTVFGRNDQPDYSTDRAFIDERLFMVFGLSTDILKASDSAPYASSALRMEFVNQMLSSYQNILQKHYRQRALVVAEAQGHFATERKGDSRIPIYEEYLVVDDDGNKVIKRKPKLLIPDLHFKTMNLRDEATERAFLLQLTDKGVPLSSKDLLIGIPFEFNESLQRKQDEAVKTALSDAETQGIIEKTLQGKGFVMKLDPTGNVVWITKEQASLEQAQSEEQAAQQKAQFEQGTVPPGGGGNKAIDNAPTSSDDKAKVDDKKDSNAVDGTATGGGGRPNVSDEKKKDAPKPKKAVKEGSKDVFVESLPAPTKRIKRPMIAKGESNG